MNSCEAVQIRDFYWIKFQSYAVIKTTSLSTAYELNPTAAVSFTVAHLQIDRSLRVSSLAARRMGIHSPVWLLPSRLNRLTPKDMLSRGWRDVESLPVNRRTNERLTEVSLRKQHLNFYHGMLLPPQLPHERSSVQKLWEWTVCMSLKDSCGNHKVWTQINRKIVRIDLSPCGYRPLM